MLYNQFGSSDFQVSVLGFGAGEIGSPEISDAETGVLLNIILDEGINLIDTARGYHLSEERIGRLISHRRDEFLLSTKVGYGIEGYADWTYDCVLAGIDNALRLLRTDYLDIVHLHSCPASVLRHNGVIDALLRAKESGKIRCAAYSGENEDLDFALATGLFNSIQTSINIFDQRGIFSGAARAAENGLGVIGKRPVGNCPWLYADRPYGNYAEQYWVRMRAMELDFGNHWGNIALRFSAFHGNAHSVITGSRNIAHVQENLRSILDGPLDDSLVKHIYDVFRACDDNWTGQI